MAGELRPVKAIKQGAIKIKGNLFAVSKFQSKFLQKYGWKLPEGGGKEE